MDSQTQPQTASAQPENVRPRSKAEIKAKRLSWAIWAAGVYKRASESEQYQMINDNRLPNE